MVLNCLLKTIGNLKQKANIINDGDIEKGGSCDDIKTGGSKQIKLTELNNQHLIKTIKNTCNEQNRDVTNKNEYSLKQNIYNTAQQFSNLSKKSGSIVFHSRCIFFQCIELNSMRFGFNAVFHFSL